MHVLCFCCVFVVRIACMCCSLFCICCANIKRLLRMFLLGPICTAFAAHYFISILCAQLFACIAQFLFICCAYCLHALDACSAFTVFAFGVVCFAVRIVRICWAFVHLLCLSCAFVVRLLSVLLWALVPCKSSDRAIHSPLKQQIYHHFVPVTFLRGASWGRRYNVLLPRGPVFQNFVKLLKFRSVLSCLQAALDATLHHPPTFLMPRCNTLSQVPSRTLWMLP